MKSKNKTTEKNSSFLNKSAKMHTSKQSGRKKNEEKNLVKWKMTEMQQQQRQQHLMHYNNKNRKTENKRNRTFCYKNERKNSE